MKRSIITTIVCLTATLLFQLSVQAEDVLLTCSDGTTVMDVGDIVECVIDPAGDADLYEFFATDGDIILLTLTDRTGSTPSPCVQLFFENEPDPIDGWCAQETGVAHELLLDQTGLYKFLITENGDNSIVNYRVALQRLFPPPPEARTLVFDEVIPDQTIDPVPDSDVFLFDGIANDFIRITLTDRTGSTPSPCIQLFDPDMTQIDAWCAQETGVSHQLTLGATGTYTVVIRESGDNSDATYNLGLQCISGTCDGDFTCKGKKATIVGTAGDNVIIGTDGDDVIVGLGGNDIIYGLEGDDRICGGLGDDTIYGGTGNDLLFGDEGNDVIFGENGRDLLYGGEGNDSLDGGNWLDKLFGGKGNDTLEGGNNDDELMGGGGIDVCDGGNHDTGDVTDGTCECTVDIELP